MPARKPHAPRTPAGRLSRAFVPVLPVADLEALETAAREDTESQLSRIDDDTDRLYRASSIADDVNDALEPLRKDRNQLAVALWAFRRARGTNLLEATGVKNTLLNRIKMEQLGVTAIPKVEGTSAVDWHAVRDLARAQRLTDDPDGDAKLADVTSQIATLEGTGAAARTVRDSLAYAFVVDDGYSKAAVGKMIGRTAWQVGRMVQQAAADKGQQVSA